jgi:tetratricopeptide (TPR) repeat protein
MATSELCARAEEAHRAGLLEDAVALFAALDLAEGVAATDRIRVSLAQGKLFTDRVFHANRGYDEAIATLEAAHVLAERVAEALSGATALDMMGFADYYRALQAGDKDYSPLLGRFQAALARREQLNDSRGVADSLFHIGLIHERLGEDDGALDMYRRAYTLAKERGHELELSYAARHLGGLALEAGDFDAARRFFRESLTLRQQAGYTLLLPLAHIALGEVMLAQNDLDGAASQYGQAHTLAQSMQSPLVSVSSLLALSELAHARSNENARREYVEQALSRARAADLPIGIRGAEAALAAITQDRR